MSRFLWCQPMLMRRGYRERLRSQHHRSGSGQHASRLRDSLHHAPLCCPPCCQSWPVVLWHMPRPGALLLTCTMAIKVVGATGCTCGTDPTAEVCCFGCPADSAAAAGTLFAAWVAAGDDCIPCCSQPAKPPSNTSLHLNQQYGNSWQHGAHSRQHLFDLQVGYSTHFIHSRAWPTSTDTAHR
jgi:hypothetical protein